MNDIEKAIEYLNSAKEYAKSEHDELISDTEKILNVFDTAINALEKQLLKKVINATSEYDGYYGSCASCKNIIYDFTSPAFCKHCGQKLNWR